MNKQDLEYSTIGPFYLASVMCDQRKKRQTFYSAIIQVKGLDYYRPFYVNDNCRPICYTIDHYENKKDKRTIIKLHFDIINPKIDYLDKIVKKVCQDDYFMICYYDFTKFPCETGYICFNLSFNSIGEFQEWCERFVTNLDVLYREENKL